MPCIVLHLTAKFGDKSRRMYLTCKRLPTGISGYAVNVETICSMTTRCREISDYYDDIRCDFRSGGFYQLKNACPRATHCYSGN